MATSKAWEEWREDEKLQAWQEEQAEKKANNHAGWWVEQYFGSRGWVGISTVVLDKGVAFSKCRQLSTFFPLNDYRVYEVLK